MRFLIGTHEAFRLKTSKSNEEETGQEIGGGKQLPPPAPVGVARNCNWSSIAAATDRLFRRLQLFREQIKAPTELNVKI